MNTNQSMTDSICFIRCFFKNKKTPQKTLDLNRWWNLKSGFLYTISWYCATKIFFHDGTISWYLLFQISWFEPGDSMWPFHPLVGGHLTIWKGHLTIPKRSLWITWNSNLHSIPIKNRTPEVLFAPNLLFWEFQCRIHVEMMIYVGGVLWKI